MKILIRGGGDLGSGIALRLFRCGLQIVIAEIKQPLVLRRTVSFANAIYESEMVVEGVHSQLVTTADDVDRLLKQFIIPVRIDENLETFDPNSFDVIIDARMLKTYIPYQLSGSPMIIGLGPGFIAKQNCHAAIETNRGHYLGRVIWEGSPQADTAKPGLIANNTIERVIRSPADGILQSGIPLGALLEKGERLGFVGETEIIAMTSGILRGLMHDGITVAKGLKIGDIDSRGDKNTINLVSEKSLAIAGGVLEAILSQGKFLRWI